MYNLNEKLVKDIEDYCKLNDISDIETELNKILQTGFNVTRFGISPFQILSPPIMEEEKIENKQVKRGRPKKENVQEEVKEPQIEQKVEKKKSVRILKK